ncbi:MAG: hypothetical protein WA210_21755 [Burkholderiaceae bacterium]
MSRLSGALRRALLATTAVMATTAAAPAVAQARAISAEGLSAWDRVVMEATFSRADANDDGYLTKNEAARLAAFPERFDALDTDSDGTLDLEEFAAAFATAH